MYIKAAPITILQRVFPDSDLSCGEIPDSKQSSVGILREAWLEHRPTVSVRRLLTRLASNEPLSRFAIVKGTD